MSDQRNVAVRVRIDNLIESIRNYQAELGGLQRSCGYQSKGRVYTEQDLCRIYYAVKGSDSVWMPGDSYYPYRRDELVRMACDRVNPDDD